MRGTSGSEWIFSARWGEIHSDPCFTDDMIRAARERLPDIGFDVADIADWRASALVDIIPANASLQWLPDHATLYPGLVAQLAEGGCLAVQAPDNLAEPAHRIARDLVAQVPWSARLAHVTHPDRHEAAWYYALLKPLCAQVDVWRTTYFHPLQGHDAIVEWFKGSALRPYLALLDGEERPAFLDEYRRGIAAAYALHGDGTVLLPFPRLFVVATRGAQ